jgi:hypothetical protein
LQGGGPNQLVRRRGSDVRRGINTSWPISEDDYMSCDATVNSLFLVDSDGDGLLDGKSNQRLSGNWPHEWVWLEDLHTQVVVGQARLSRIGSRGVVTTDRERWELGIGEHAGLGGWNRSVVPSSRRNVRGACEDGAAVRLWGRSSENVENYRRLKPEWQASHPA